jgi:MATE family multidrug resistance protein
MVILIMVFTRDMWRGLSGHFDLKVINRLLRIGVPSGLQYVFEIGAFSMAGIMAGWISAAALAAHQIALNMVSVTYMAASGLGAAAAIRIANQMGKKDLKNLKLAGFSCLALVAVFMFLVAIFIITTRHWLIQLYIDDAAVQKIALGLLLIAAGFQISDGLQAVGLGILRGLTDVKVPAFVTFFVYWICAIPSSYLLAFHFEMGLSGIWYALSGALTLAALLHIFRFIYLANRIQF